MVYEGLSIKEKHFSDKKQRTQALRFTLAQALKQQLTGRKRGKDEKQRFEYLENKKSFLDEIKNYSHNF